MLFRSRLVRRGNDTLLRKRLTVVFENDVLVDVEGDLVGENWPEPDTVESADGVSEELSEKTPDQGADKGTAL